MSDRIAVIHDGKLMGLVEDPDRVTEEQMGLMMAGSPLLEFAANLASEGESTGKAVALQ